MGETPAQPQEKEENTQPTPTTNQNESSGAKFYTSSHHTAQYYYPDGCEKWKALSSRHLKSFNSLESLQASYSRTLSPQCQ